MVKKLTPVDPTDFLKAFDHRPSIDAAVKHFVRKSPHKTLDDAIKADDEKSSRAEMLKNTQELAVMRNNDLKAFLDLVNENAVAVTDLLKRVENLEAKTK
jgi:hypothetical protein